MSLRPIKSRKARHHSQARLKGRSDIAWGWGKKNIDWSHFFTTRKFKTLVLFVLAISTLVVLYPTSLFHSFEARGTGINITNVQPLFQETFPAGDLSDWNAINMVAVAQCFQSPTNACMQTQPVNSTDGSIAITKNSFDLGTIGTHLLYMNPVSCFAQGVPTTNTLWGVFLTRNNTLPPINHYDPRKDPSVSLLIEMQATGGSGSANHVWIQSKQDVGMIQAANSQGSGDLYLSTSATIDTNVCSTGAVRENWDALQLNYTGVPGSNQGLSELDAGGIAIGLSSTTTRVLSQLQYQGIPFYLGVFSSGCLTNCHIDFQAGSSGGNGLMVSRADPNHNVMINAPTANVDTGGFFGPIIKALLSLGVFIMANIFSFFSYLASVLGPVLATTFTVLENVWVAVLNAIGGILGFGNVGTDLQTLLGNVISFFTQQVPTIFANTGALFARFFDVNSVYFSWLPTALNIAVTIATLAVNGVVFILTIIDFSFRLVGGVYLIILLTLFLVYTGDDALGGILGFLETTQWLILGPLGWLTKILNFALDIVTYIVGLIPKPFIQMVAHSIPRLPIIETSARFVNPSFDLAAIRNGNMLAVWAWFVDFTFLAWYNGVTPALPGSLGFLLPGMPATTFAALRGFLPMLEICLIVISALAFIIWPVNKMFSMISLDLDFLDFDMSPGRKISQTGLGSVRLKIGKKRLQGRLAKKLEKRKEERMEHETRKVVSVEEERKIVEQTARLKEEHERLKKLEERNK